ncbi:putative aldouronate transport system permease protein [Paenibacillus sp. UNCCL117]|uniref:carbohydrate ABC transporter permease n=1 Tax=unclassified Paenibacillus TaxID=185978 RepID=UPI0008882C1D|nr:MULTISPECIES: carbohydrate ABC transporter permease [unclassified Paenibacillus]SDD89759.1 putative aldouronate transport system permease protein [Paenibacillus sp. cl123]SFW44080.1 putative aldouronate transport system permease protein [Paenibacillus sp. UNCCL117]
MSFVQKKRMTLFDWVNYSGITLISAACIFPFLYVFSVSFTDPQVYVPLKFYLFPDKWSLESYRYILSTNSFLNALKSTTFITVVGTILNIIVSFTMAYGLTKRTLPGHKWIMGCVVFTLVFSAGIVPNYLLVKELGLLNSYWSLIWPSLTNAWSLIVIKSFMDSLPSELEDAARIDGCSDIGVFTRIILPLSLPAIAAFTLFFAVAHWNTYFNALVYIADSKKWTLQILVKTLVIDSNSVAVAQAGASDEAVVPQETIRMASIVLAMAPILIVYPFLQKHFAKGVMLGSVKG